MTPAGLEPAIPGSVGRCLIHWATGPVAFLVQLVMSTLHAFWHGFPRHTDYGVGESQGFDGLRHEILA